MQATEVTVRQAAPHATATVTVTQYSCTVQLLQQLLRHVQVQLQVQLQTLWLQPTQLQLQKMITHLGKEAPQSLAGIQVFAGPPV